MMNVGRCVRERAELPNTPDTILQTSPCTLAWPSFPSSFLALPPSLLVQREPPQGQVWSPQSLGHSQSFRMLLSA